MLIAVEGQCIGMVSAVLQSMPSGLLEIAISIALTAGVVLFIGGLVSFAVFAYRSLRGEGMKDPREIVPEKTRNEEGVTKGDPEDEWEYY